MTYTGGRLQRAIGHVQLGVRRNSHGTTIHSLYQSGCLKIRFPHPHGPTCEAVLINISGGVADGDALGIDLDLAENSHLGFSTVAAERIYRALHGAPPASILMRASIGPAARLDYLPQETLLFECCALNRALDIDMHPTATFLGVEARLFGRPLSGETLTTLHLNDRITLRRGGRLIVHDTLRLQGNAAAILAAPAGAHGNTAAATILFAAPDAARFLDPLRASLDRAEAGASAWNGMLIARLLAPDGHALRRALIPALQILLDRPLPRLWAY